MRAQPSRSGLSGAKTSVAGVTGTSKRYQARSHVQTVSGAIDYCVPVPWFDGGGGGNGKPLGMGGNPAGSGIPDGNGNGSVLGNVDGNGGKIGGGTLALGLGPTAPASPADASTGGFATGGLFVAGV